MAARMLDDPWVDRRTLVLHNADFVEREKKGRPL